MEIIKVLSGGATEVLQERSEYAKALRGSRTPKRKIKTRQGKDGKIFKYIGPLEAYKWLDEHYPLWSMEVSDSYHQIANWLYVRVTVTIYDSVTGVQRTISRLGGKEAIITKDGGNLASIQYLKAAETDAVKRIVVALGGYNDVYSSDEDLGEDEEELRERRQWYVNNILPKVMEVEIFKMNPERIIEQILRYEAGLLSKEKLSQTFLGV